MKRAYFLYNGPNPELAPTNEFTVTEGAGRITAKTTMGFYLEVSVGIGAEQAWTEFSRYGTLVELTSINVQHVELVPGRYRVVPNGDTEDHATDLVYFEEDEFLSNDKNVRMSFTQAFV